MKIRVGVFFGGKSVEHEVSVITAMQAIAALDPEKYQAVPVYITKDSRFFWGEHLLNLDSFRDIPAALKKAERVIPVREGKTVNLLKYPSPRWGNPVAAQMDVALPLGHGSHTEDGCLQGVLEYLDLPYAGCSVAASACSMDKWAMKALFTASGLPVVPGVKALKTAYYKTPEKELTRIEQTLHYPLIVKPYNLGSSVGIGVARDRNELARTLEDVFALSSAALCELQVQNLREINCSVVGDDEKTLVSMCEEPFSGGGFLSYRDKYQSGGKTAKGPQTPPSGSKGMAGLSRQIPAQISEEMTKQVQSLSQAAFQALGCAGVARVDFLLDDQTGRLYVNEINTIPGSLAFYLWEPAGVSYPELLDRLIDLALKRRQEEDQIHYSFETNLLSEARLSGRKR